MVRPWLITAIIGGILLLGAGWYLLSPLFIDDVVDEKLPFEIEEKEQKSSKTIETEEQENQTTKQKGEIPTAKYMGSFQDADDFHKVSGMAVVLEQDGKRFLRFEDFKATNGPDLKVYLATDTKATDFVSLGTLKGNIGNQNYEIPADVDLDTHSEVLIWCRAFSVLFGNAELNPDA